MGREDDPGLLQEARLESVADTGSRSLASPSYARGRSGGSACPPEVVKLARGRTFTFYRPRLMLVLHVNVEKIQKQLVNTQLLSPREADVFASLIITGHPSVTARELFLSIKTVSTYKARLLEKLELKNEYELMRFALACGYVHHTYEEGEVWPNRAHI